VMQAQMRGFAVELGNGTGEPVVGVSH
jgi:hypothetical protein